MSLTDSFLRVSRRRLCPVCHRPDWCMVSKDDPENPPLCICSRMESRIKYGDAGWLHVLDAKRDRRPPRHEVRIDCRKVEDHGVEARRYAETGLARLPRLADELSVTVEALRRLRVGWCEQEHCWTFPLFNAAGVCIGINRRLSDGSKRVFAGHRIGLYLPHDLPLKMTGQTLLIVEGGSDTAAGLDFGYQAIGRFSCSSGGEEVRRLVRQRQPRRVVIVADADEPGIRGSARLRDDLRRFCIYISVIAPPAKDLRQWRQDGASVDDLRLLIEEVQHVR